MSLENIKDKIRKLFAVSSSTSGATESEQASAMKLAAIMMAKHNLKEEEIGTSDKPKAKFGETNAKRALAYRLYTAQAAGILYGCSMLMHDKGQKGFTFIGRPDNIAAAEETYEWLVDQINSLYKPVVPPELKGNWRSAWVEKFRVGCALRVLSRARNLVEELTMPAASSGTSLVATGYFKALQAENTSVMNAVGNIRSAKIGGVGKTSMDAVISGQIAGDKVKLRREVQ